MTLLLPMAGWTHVPEVDLLADMASALVLLGGGVLVFRSFRQRYLLWWIFGWASYVIYRSSSDLLDLTRSPAVALAISQSAFIVAVTLFAAAVFQYVRRFQLMIPVVILAGITLELTILQYSYWPGNLGLMLAIQILYRVITFWAAIKLVRYSLGRGEVGPWLMALMLCLIHMDTAITKVTRWRPPIWWWTRCWD